MGSTGRTSYESNKAGQRTELNSKTFGIPKAIPFKGKPPEGSNIAKPASNNVTLKFNVGRTTNILFQFKLSKDNKLMTIIGFRNGVPEVKTKVEVEAGRPSLDRVIATGKASERTAALKIRSLMNQSSEISETQLSAIANSLLRKKQVRKG